MRKSIWLQLFCHKISQAVFSFGMFSESCRNTWCVLHFYHSKETQHFPNVSFLAIVVLWKPKHSNIIFTGCTAVSFYSESVQSFYIFCLDQDHFGRLLLSYHFQWIVISNVLITIVRTSIFPVLVLSLSLCVISPWLSRKQHSYLFLLCCTFFFPLLVSKTHINQKVSEKRFVSAQWNSLFYTAATYKYWKNRSMHHCQQIQQLKSKKYRQGVSWCNFQLCPNRISTDKENRNRLTASSVANKGRFKLKRKPSQLGLLERERATGRWR